MLSHEQPVGVKCMWKRGWRSSQRALPRNPLQDCLLSRVQSKWCRCAHTGPSSTVWTKRNYHRYYLRRTTLERRSRVSLKCEYRSDGPNRHHLYRLQVNRGLPVPFPALLRLRRPVPVLLIRRSLESLGQSGPKLFRRFRCLFAILSRIEISRRI